MDSSLPYKLLRTCLLYVLGDLKVQIELGCLSRLSDAATHSSDKMSDMLGKLEVQMELDFLLE